MQGLESRLNEVVKACADDDFQVYSAARHELEVFFAGRIAELKALLVEAGLGEAHRQCAARLQVDLAIVEFRLNTITSPRRHKLIRELHWRKQELERMLATSLRNMRLYERPRQPDPAHWGPEDDAAVAAELARFSGSAAPQYTGVIGRREPREVGGFPP